MTGAAVTLLAALALQAAGAGVDAASDTYRSRKHGFSFSYPAGLRVVESAAKKGDLARVDVLEGPCTVARLRLVRTDKAKIVLPKRFSYPSYDRARNMWTATDEESQAAEPVCLDAATLESGLRAYAHTDAMHGWWTQVVLTDAGTALVWSNAGDPEETFCAFEPKRLSALAGTLAFSGKLRSIEAKCPGR